jgi:crotonobetainyl-CoA:carnitine CoA-transferase CaiB-like acyl-CoA transferase
MADGPLTGYRVIDCADVTGALCGRFMAELGADVIRIEPPQGDWLRRSPPFAKDTPGPDSSLRWWWYNASKRGVTLDIAQERGRDLFRKLVSGADVLVETYRPGYLASLGLAYGSLSGANPGLVHTSITPFGSDGPYAGFQATDIVLVAMGGHMYLNGDPERSPVRVTAPQAYAQGAIQGTVGTLTALYARAANDGLGQQVDVSIQEAMTWAMDNAQPTWDIRQINTERPGLGRMIGGYKWPRYLFEASDGWVAVLGFGAATTYEPLMEWMGEEAGPLREEPFTTKITMRDPPMTPEEEATFDATLDAFFRKRTREEIVSGAQARRSGWAPVLSPRELVENEHLAARDYWTPVDHGEFGTIVYPGAPYKLSETPWRLKGPAPRLGQHNAEVYGELGVSEETLAELRSAGVI